jgi:cobalt/nickel transport system permease protein
VINTIAQLDFLASSGRTPWHRASAVSKLALAAVAVALAVFAPGLPLQGALFVAALALAASSRLPVRLLAAAVGSPVLFTALFVALRWDGTWQGPLAIALRPLAATLFVLWLVGTTPYPDLFAPLARVLPRSVGDGLFLTYRALFELLARTLRLFRAFHLRGAESIPARRRLPLAGDGLATLVLYSFERSQRMYSTMLVRGHSGRVCGCRHWAEGTRADLWVALAGVVLATGAGLLWGMR